MSKFNNKLNTVVETTNLTKVRIKIDPAKWKPGCNVNELDEFHGYILQEFDDGTMDIYIPANNSIMNMLGTDVETPDRYNALKKLILTCLEHKGNNDTQVVDGITKADCIHTIEDWMRHGGMSESEIIDIFKEYISETT